MKRKFESRDARSGFKAQCAKGPFATLIACKLTRVSNEYESDLSSNELYLTSGENEA